MKKSRLKLAIYLLVPISIIAYYQVKMSRYAGVQYVTCYEVKPNIMITKGTALNQNMFTFPIQIDKSKVSANYVKTLDNIDKKVALENLYGNDVLTDLKIEDKQKWDDEKDRYISITSSDYFNGSDVKPGDIVDVFIYDMATKQYIEEVDNLLVLDVKDKDGVSFIDSDSKFLPNRIYFKNNNTDFKNIIDKLGNSNSKVQISIHGNRPNVQKNKVSSTDKGLINVK